MCVSVCVGVSINIYVYVETLNFNSYWFVISLFRKQLFR